MRCHERDEVERVGLRVRPIRVTLARSIVHRGSRTGHNLSTRFQYIDISWVLITMQVRLDSTTSKVGKNCQKTKDTILLTGFELVISDTHNTVY